ncbi:MAG: FAD-dependent oxidoreductase [Clostridia bacterium]|nr:FAD-dependent oxidoreductase [Clostridia bacterium]
MLYTKQIPIKYDVDIFVAGGGPSGVAAAVTAARQGKRVFLAENNGCFGGSGTVGLVPAFAQFTDGERFLVGGVGREVRYRVVGEACNYSRAFCGVKVETLKKTYDDIVTAEENIQFSFFTRLIDVIATDGHIDCAILAAKSGIFAVKAKIYVDCTGDADLSAMAGADTEFGDENGVAMPSTLCSLWSDVDYSQKSDADFMQALENAFKDGVFSVEDRHVSGFFPFAKDSSIAGANIGHCFDVDARDETSLTKAMLRGRSYMSEFGKFYREYIGGPYKNAHLCYTADMLGIRESRRVVCDYRLSGSDFLARASFPDEIGRYAYPVDIHIMKPDKASYDKFLKEYSQDMHYGVGESYGIPYRSLIPAKLDNALVAGRCIGTDRQMQASVRVMPGCFITGTAAGIAASLAVKTQDTRRIDISELREKIRQDFGEERTRETEYGAQSDTVYRY